MSKRVRSAGARPVQLACGFALLCAFSSQPASAQEAQRHKPWAVSVNATQVFVKEAASDVTLAGGPVPGADVRIGNATSVTADIGYFLTPNLAANLFFGIPAPAKIEAAGSIEPLGTLAKVKYGPVILSGQYHFDLGPVHPYVGLGVARILFMNARDGSLTGFSIEDRWAPATQAGLRVELAESWMLNADVRYVPFSTRASGSLGGAPVRARLEIDPVLASAGLTYRF